MECLVPFTGKLRFSFRYGWIQGLGLSLRPDFHVQVLSSSLGLFLRQGFAPSSRELSQAYILTASKTSGKRNLLVIYF